MGFYGNVSNVGKTNMVFDKIYSSRADMDAHCDGDGVYAGRYVLIEYERLSPDDTIHTIYAPASDTIFYRAYSDIACTVLFTGAKQGEVYRLIRVNNGAIVLNEYYLYDGQSYNSLADFDGKTPISQLPGGTSSEANYIINFNKDKLIYENIRGYDSTVWMKSFYTDGEDAGKGYYINIAELNSVVPSFGITVDAPTAIPKGPYFDEDSTNIYYDLHLQPSWGFRVKKIPANDESNDKSDVKIKYQTWNEAVGKMEEIENIDGAIYFNNAGFNPKKAFKDTTVTDSIKIAPSPSGKLYNGKVENDVYDLSIQLPSIGNMMSDVWDRVHGPERDDYMGQWKKKENLVDGSIFIDNGVDNEDYILDGNERKDFSSFDGRLKSISQMEGETIPVKKSSDGSIIGASINKEGTDDWIVTSIDSEKSNITIKHKTKFEENQTNSRNSQNPAFGSSFNIPIIAVDKAGHIISLEDNSVQLPQGSLTINDEINNVSKVITDLSFTPASGSTIAKNRNVGELLLTGYEANENGYITAQNFINQAFKTLDAQALECSKNIATINEEIEKIPSWAKASTKPTYTADEVGALPATTVIPTKLSELNNDMGFLTEHQSLTTLEEKIAKLEERIEQLENPTTTE